MSHGRWGVVDRYISELFVPSDPLLEETLRAMADAGILPTNVTPQQGKFLHILAGAKRASQILEIGTLGGYSTIWLARALPCGGRLISLEADMKHAELARSNIARAGLAGVVEVRPGPVLETVSHLVAEGEGPFDFVFINADRSTIPACISWAL